jgi:pyrroline-5-carboxylate reductase
MTVFGFIGTGHLGSMLVHKFIETGAIYPEDIMAANRTPEKAARLEQATGIQVAGNRIVAELSDVLFICVQPADVRDVLSELKDVLTADKLVVSVAADVRLEMMQSLCTARLARAFPSMASRKGQGETLLCYAHNATREDRSLISGLFQPLGGAEEVAEEDFAVLADLTSCGPGYYAAIMREFSLAAERKGIPPELAERLIGQTLLGTALLLQEESFSGLIESVATKGGITEAGVSVIRDVAPAMFDRLFQATEERHRLVRRRVEERAQGSQKEHQGKEGRNEEVKRPRAEGMAEGSKRCP